MRRILLLLALLVLPFAARAEENPLKTGDNAVAWRVFKRMVVVPLHVAGINRTATAEVVATAKDIWQVKVQIPIAGFHSGVGKRDTDAGNLLGIKKQPVMTFQSLTMSTATLVAMRSGEGKLEGDLNINGHDNRLVFDVKGDGKAIGGHVHTSFSGLGLQSPRFVGGVIMLVGDDFDLYFQYDLDHIKGQELVK
jgi:hypothetical protein